MPGVFPTLVANPDSTKFEVEYEDPSKKTEMEGGYMVSRRRHTRTPRETFKITYSYITQADRDLLITLYEAMGGGSDYFSWTNPENNLSYNVRFKTPLRVTYRGRFNFKRYDVSFELEEV